MKSGTCCGIIIAVASFILLSPALADSSPISVRAEQKNKISTDKKDHKVITETHSLTLFVSNSSNEQVIVNARCTFFGREVRSHHVVIIREDNTPVEVKAAGTITVTIAPAISTYTTAHENTSPVGLGAILVQSVETSGAKFIGYAVRIFHGEKQVAEVYDPANAKDLQPDAGAQKVDGKK